MSETPTGLSISGEANFRALVVSVNTVVNHKTGKEKARNARETAFALRRQITDPLDRDLIRVVHIPQIIRPEIQGLVTTLFQKSTRRK